MNRKTALLTALVISAVFVGVAVAATQFVPTSGSISLESNDGTTIRVQNADGIDFNSAFVDDQTINASTENNGQATFSSSGNVTAEVAASDIEGQWTVLTNMNVSNANLTVNPGDKPSFTVGGGATKIEMRDTIAVDDGKTDFKYSGNQGSPTIVIVDGLPANTPIIAYDANADDGLGTATTDGSGELAISLENSAHSVQLRTSNGDPTLANPRPQGDQNSTVDELAVDVDDADFAQGANVTVTFKNETGVVVGTDTLSSPGTAKTTISEVSEGGQHNWTAEAQDFAGTTTETYNYKIPDELRIFEETNPSQLIDNATVEVRFFSESDKIFERTTSNGTIKLTDLPVDDRMEVTAQADGYVNRKIVINSIFQQSELYLLNESATTDEVLWQLDDLTGNFPAADTQLSIQRPITKDFNGDGDNSTRFRTVEGGEFDASGDFPSTLETGQRYRIVVQNDDGDRRVLGNYDAAGDATEVLEIGQLEFGGDVESNATMDARLFEDDQGNRKIRIKYRDSEELTSQLEINVTNTDNGSSIHSTTVNGEFGEYQETISVPQGAPDDVSYQVKVISTRDGSTQTQTEFVGDIAAIAQMTGINSTVLFWAGWIGLISIMGLVVVFDDALAALVGWVVATGFTALGAISIPPLALAFSGIVALLYNVARRAT